MMWNIEHKRGRYSRFEDGVIIKSVRQYGTAKGLDLAASQLNRRRVGIEKHYYKNIAANKPEADKVDVSVPREVKSVQVNVAGIELYLTFK